MNPVIAVVLGTLLLGEPFGVRMLIAAAIIALGMLIVGITPRASEGRKETLAADPLPVRRAS